jgi:L-alanine-DL-glutamate epimerase-like enolase superfamily enzyme
MKITDIERIHLYVPFHEVADRNMRRMNEGWHICEILRVETDAAGITGYGETLPNYTWGRVTDAAIERARGANPFDILWDDALGAGLQMAVLDICGKAAEVPAHRLLGTQVRDRCPISWWGVDMSPADYAAEARDALAAGYTSFKQKARPWWDVYEQAKLTAAETGPDFKLDFDFNQHLNNAATALPVIAELDRTPQIWIYESPIPQDDLDGNRRIRAFTRCAVAMHYGHPIPEVAVREGVADGWVVGGGLTACMKAAYLCEQLNMPYWLQLVGTAWTTTMAAHIGAVSRHAQWPAVTCMNMYVDPLVTKPIKVRGGLYDVPDAPGLGIDFNEEALKYRVDGPDCPPYDLYNPNVNKQAMYAIVRADGEKTWYDRELNGAQGFWSHSLRGNVPAFEHGVKLETWANDGSNEWKKLAERVKKGPVLA